MMFKDFLHDNNQSTMSSHITGIQEQHDVLSLSILSSTEHKSLYSHSSRSEFASTMSDVVPVRGSGAPPETPHDPQPTPADLSHEQQHCPRHKDLAVGNVAAGRSHVLREQLVLHGLHGCAGQAPCKTRARQ